VRISTCLHYDLSLLNPAFDSPSVDVLTDETSALALAHHRLGWINPLANSDERLVHLLTFSLLIKYGFKVQGGGRVLNPTAAFCNDRDRYYACWKKPIRGFGRSGNVVHLCAAEHFGELRKVDRLTDFTYLADNILLPAIVFARERELITMAEARILQLERKRASLRL
jgi:hypothetical protein